MTKSGPAVSNKRPSRHSLEKEDEERFQRTKEIWAAITTKSLELRDSEREFHGFQGELRRIGAGIKDQYEKSRSIKHVRDLGAHREELLRVFFQESGLLPLEYGVSQTSSRVIGSSGHASKEIDLLLFERSKNIILRKFGRSLEFYPADTTFGVIQVKSNLTYAEIDKSFDNIASFKRIYNFNEDACCNTVGMRGFGLVFAFESKLTHSQIADRIKENMIKYQPRELPNSISILNGSSFRFGDDNGGYLLNENLDLVDQIKIYGDLNVLGDSFYRFYAELMELLRRRRPSQIILHNYFDLPLLADGISYRFQHGTSSETMKCPTHGTYLRRFSEGSAIKVFENIKNVEPIHWIKAMDIACGKAGDDFEAYSRQPGEVRIYNPEKFPLNILLISKNGNLAYDDLKMNEINVWVPWLYDVKEALFADCPSCRRVQKARERRKKTDE